MRFCGTTYDVTFPMFAKIGVNGDHAHPLYQYLKSAQKGILGTESIKWNLTKFLVESRPTSRHCSASLGPRRGHRRPG